MNLLTIKVFCQTYSWPSEGGMRNYIQKAKQYGLEDAFLRIGKRILVNPEKFFELIKDYGKRKLINETEED